MSEENKPLASETVSEQATQKTTQDSSSEQYIAESKKYRKRAQDAEARIAEMEKKFANVISLQRERDSESKRRVLDTYKDMLRHYRQEGLGERSKYAGCIIKQDMIDTLERRYIQLGGNLEDV